MAAIEKMFNPETVAVIGATDSEGSVGRSLMKNLLLGKHKRTIFPVNPNHANVAGLKSYPSVSKIPGHVDLAVIATPAKTVPSLVEECAESGVEGAVIISAGFREVGSDGLRLEEQIREIKRNHDIRILGPNCVGMIRPHLCLNTSFLRDNPEPGQIAFISQSGALGAAILNWAVSARIGFSLFASLGSTLDIDYGDMIDYLGEDPHTRSIIIYMEDVRNAKKFMSAARGFARTKPIIVLKAGRNPAGAKAASSHTGALAGDYEVYDAAFKRVGVVMVDEIGDLFNCASVLDSRFLPAGPRLAIVTNAGGPGVLAADAIVSQRGVLAELTEESLRTLDSKLPPYWSHGNPLDIIGDADIERYETAVRTCVSDPHVDGLLVIYTPQGTTDPMAIAEAVVRIAADRRKPILTVWMGEDSVRDARDLFRKEDIPTYPTPEEAVKTYMYMYRYKSNLDLLYETPEELSVDFSPPKSHLKVLVQRALKEGRTSLSPTDVDRFLDAYGIPRAPSGLAKNVEQASAVASQIGYPVALKIASADILHKTDARGIELGVGSPDQVTEQFNSLLERVQKLRPQAKIDGVYVQKMTSGVDCELILGAKKDPHFGSVILFGMGGTTVEMVRDFSIGLPPLNQVLARRVMEETKVYHALVKGLRNRPPVESRLLEGVMIRFSNLIVDFPEIAEIDINPLVVSNGKLVSLDARIVLDPNVPAGEAHPHLVILPYPTKWVTPWTLKDGTEVVLRPIRPEDEPIELELIRGLSPETSRFRFFQVIKDLPHEALVRFCNIDYNREMAFIAETREGDRRIEIGVARLILEPNRKRGEFAVVVADRHQGKGLGTKLVDMLIAAAREWEVETMYGIVMAENTSMIRLCEKLGFTIQRKGENVLAELHLK